MPTIRVEEDVFNGLKSIAEPFTDTPNSVIRRLLEKNGTLRRNEDDVLIEATKVRDIGNTRNLENRQLDALTPQPIYETFLVYVLGVNFSGRAGKHEVTKAVIKKMKEHGFIGPADLKAVSTGETKAENTIAWGRNALKDEGFISHQSRRGIWELTVKGMERAKSTDLPHKAL